MIQSSRKEKQKKDMERIITGFVEMLYPFFIKKIQKDNYLKNCLRMKTAVVKSVPQSDSETLSNIGEYVDIILPFDDTAFPALNNTGEELSIGDSVCFMYWIDLKNSVVMFKK